MNEINQLKILKPLSVKVMKANEENNIDTNKLTYGTPLVKVFVNVQGAMPSFAMLQSTREQQYTVLFPAVKAIEIY